MTEDAWEVIREVLLDLHDLDRHLRDVEPGEGCEDCEILLAPLTTLREQVERQKAALRVYTSPLHRCSTRPCSCGAYTSLTEALSTEEPSE